jgi:hypothetical protein
MDLKLTPVSMPTSVRGSTGVRPTSAADTQGVDGGFSGVLNNALTSVSASQAESSRLQREVRMENPKVSHGGDHGGHIRRTNWFSGHIACEVPLASGLH